MIRLRNLFSFLIFIIPCYVALQLCNPYTAAYPCTACQPFAQLSGGYCSCQQGYYMNTDNDDQYCGICHTSCASCYGPLETNCIDCSDKFTFDADDSSCQAPNDINDQTIVEAYTFPGFTKLSGWTVTFFSADTYQCGTVTLLGGWVTSWASRNIYVSLTSLPAHFQLRVKVNYYFLNANGVTKSAVVQIGSNSEAVAGSDSTYSFHQCNGYYYLYRAVDVSIPHSGSTASVQFITNANVRYGIRDVFVIAKKCHKSCATCSGYQDNQCLTCTQSTKRAPVAGVCKCKDSYYQEPYAGECVDPCPSVPTKTYGDNDTRSCAVTCPGSGFAYDDLYRCWTDCPTVSIRNSLKLFKDITNKKCVTNCPSTEPYADQTSRTCYQTCPGTKKSVNTTEMRCVDTCPHTTVDSGIYKTFAHNKQCIPYCPTGYWGDPGTAICRTVCLTTATYKYMDNSTGNNLCVSTCPAPNRFTNPLTYYCVETCPSPYFGDSDRMCKTICASPLWGILGYNRKCVDKCPTNTWAEPTSRICVAATTDCNPKFANSFLRQCVVKQSCQLGTFADPTTYKCVIYCPSGSFGNSITQKCETSCVSPYYADSGNNLCLTVCMTQNTYASTSPTRACVVQCNITSSSTKWADDSIRKCVSDCNNSVAAYVSDNTTWKCVYECPLPLVADRTTTIPKCVTVCPTNYYADFTSGTGICVARCPSNPVMFGDADGGINMCVSVCTAGTFGDETGNRLCKKTCPTPYFSQNNGLRRCVIRCNSSTYGYQQTCTYHITNCQYSYKRLCYQDPHSCPTNYFGDTSTNLCVNPCPAVYVTFGDPLSKLCVRICPDNPNANMNQPNTYYADSSIRQCVLTCNSSHTTPLFGSNQTRECVPVCLDYQAYAQTQTTYRLCVAQCLKTPILYYANKQTKVCGPSINCQTGYYGQNSTQICVQLCPSSTTNWAYKNAAQKICVLQCPSPQHGDNSTSKFVCVDVCPTVPDRYADTTDRICVDTCDPGQYGQPINRECVGLCPNLYYALDTTGRCVSKCPSGFFGDETSTVRKCWPTSAQCTSGFGDSYLRKCVPVCTGPTPVNSFGSGTDCVTFCPNNFFADSYTGTRLCVSVCPGTVDSLVAPNLYGDPTTHTCVPKCITPLTWADPHSRKCQPQCSTTPPLYSQNFAKTCVSSSSCPTTPTMTFGDNDTRSCVSFCSNNEFGDPNSRNCVSRCPDDTQTLTETYYGDSSTGQHICVANCPETPRLFGENITNLCVTQCPGTSWGDQTGKRSCVLQCPIITGVYHYAQNEQKICVTVCIDNTWGLQSTQKCVETPTGCGALWADSSTHLCVSLCPQISGLFGDPNLNLCVSVCPINTFASDYTRTCVTRCPETNGLHDTFGNNDTHICEQVCQQSNAFADPQNSNRYCVLECSQSPSQSFADPSTKSCVPQCPTHPSLFGEIQNFSCVQNCVSPYFAHTHTRRCETSCPAGEYKLLNPRKCVNVCPSYPELYGDTNSGFCEATCTGGYFKYGVTRMCISSCSTYNMFQYNNECVKYCPSGYFANSTSNCITPCPGTTFGENTTTKCESTCITGFAHNALCKAICPDGLYGENHICVGTCSGGIASDINNLCVSTCQEGTFSQGGICQLTCSSGNYADPDTHLCSTSCTSGRYGDSTTNKCVEVCPVNWFRDVTGYCKDDCSPKRADNITLTCTDKCSNGTWGYEDQCIAKCPGTYYGYQVDRDCYDLTSPPAVNLFADNETKTWVSVCSENPLKFGDRQTLECVTACSDISQYADPYSRECETACTNTSYYLDSTNKFCVLVCHSGYNANIGNGKCQQNCTNNRFDYQPSHQCVITCPKPYYGLDLGTNLKTCVLQCPAGKFAEDSLCKSSCTLPLYADSTTHRCVSDCIDSFALDAIPSCQATCTSNNEIADNSTNKCVTLCPADPDYYEQNGVCVMHCQQANHYTDPTANVRQCTTLCTEGLYGDPISGRCLTQCLPGYFAFNDTNICVTQCPNGFADNQTRVCVSDCPSPTFADSLTNKCIRICSGTQYGEGRICIATCTDGLYGNPITRQCEIQCPDFDYTFAENNTNLCVKNCSQYPNQYADRNNNVCVSNCTLSNQFMLDVYAICLSLCPEGQFMENSTKRCQTGCTTGYAEPTSRFCVARCFGNPQTFAHQSSKTCKYSCLSSSENLYADNSSSKCVAYDSCNSTVGYFSDPISGYCVLFCPQGYYAENDTLTCTTYCVNGFADNQTRKCVIICPLDKETYGDPTTHTCVKVCPDLMYAQKDNQVCVDFSDCPVNTWADDMSKHCVARCPSQPLFFGYNATRSCVQICPSSPDLFGDYISQTCIISCYTVAAQWRFADHLSRTCVFVCPIEDNLYGDPNTGKCQTACSSSWLLDNSTQRCVASCPSDPDYYALISEGRCVRVCPNGFYASVAAGRICIQDCGDHSTFGDPTNNRCVTQCPEPYFADQSTDKCVLDCPTTPNYYSDPHTRKCVDTCPWDSDWRTFAEDTYRTCVTRCPNNLYAQNSSRKCVANCPSNQYADQVIKVCVIDCTVRPLYYKQTNSGICVQQCPDGTGANVKAYKYQPTHICVQTSGTSSGCTGLYYANVLNNYCTTLCPHGYFAEDSTKYCVKACSPSQYADPIDRKCKAGCTPSPNLFALTATQNQCVQYCPSPYFSENVTWTCVQNCPNKTASEVLYAYPLTRQCVFNCPSPYYSYITNQTCLQNCPDGLFTQDETRSCDSQCVDQYFADPSTNRCVQLCPENPQLYGHLNQCLPSCPDGFYKDISTRQCVSLCPVQPLLYGDNSTNTCVEDCPSDPNFFADNETQICVYLCSPGTYAETTTRTCMAHCPDSLKNYAYEGPDPTTSQLIRVCQGYCPSPFFSSDLTQECVSQCPNLPNKTYSYIDNTQLTNKRKCVFTCPSGTFGDNNTWTCKDNCLDVPNSWSDSTTHLCVTTCPYGFFGYNSSSQCRRDCPGGLYADNSTRMCVVACPGTQRLFADPSTYECVSQCPTGYYGDTSQWKCITACSATATGYILEVSRLCVQQCPEPYFAQVSQRLCVTNCGNGLFGDPVTRQCKTCPTQCVTCLALDSCLSCGSNLYLQFGRCISQCTLNNQIANYANSLSMKCVSAKKCEAGKFGYNATKKCQSSCPAQMYGNTTQRVCQHCPTTCAICTASTICTSCIATAEFATSKSFCYSHCNSTHRYKFEETCVLDCPSGSYKDFTNVRCESCNQICLTCIGNALNCTNCDGTFRLNNSCVTQCPAGYYANSQECLICSDTIQSCSEPLTFETQTYTQNYKQVIVMKFNKKTIINGDPKDFIKIKITAKRLLQSSVSDLVNNGALYTAQILPDGTIKFYLNSGVSLDNVNYQIVVTDPTKIQSQSGATLQVLQSLIQLQNTEAYPQEALQSAPLVVAGKIFAIVILVITLFNFLIGLIPAYLAIQALQITSLFAYCEQLPPNLYYFLKQLRYGRFTFMPNIFTGIYVESDSYVGNIPQRVVDTQGQLSFAYNGTTFFFFIFIYMFMAAVIYIFTSRINSNRPLKNLFIKIHETRTKFGILNDFIWLFAINILIHMAFQFYYVENGSDLGLGISFGLLTVGVMFGLFIYGFKLHSAENSTNYQQRPVRQHQHAGGFDDNYYMFSEGTKDQKKHKLFFFFYYIRKILFVFIMFATVFNSLIQASLLMALFIMMCLIIIIIRPYQQHTRNLVVLVNEGFMGFLAGGIIYFHKMIELGDPSGAKITCGNVLIIVIIVHLSLISIYSLYRTYYYVQHLKEQFLKTEFYMLYMDEEYDESIEKQLSEIAGKQDGEIQSIQITNVDTKNDYGAIQSQQEGEQIIKLKIKRKVKKGLRKTNNSQQIDEQSKRKGKRENAEYQNLKEADQNYYELKPKLNSGNQYQKMDINHSPEQQPQRQQQKQMKHGDNNWIQMKPDQADQPQIQDKKSIDNDNYEQIRRSSQNGIDNIFEDTEVDIEEQINENVDEIADQNVDEKEEKQQNKQIPEQEQKVQRPGTNRTEKKIRFLNDFHEDTFFPEESKQNQQEQKIVDVPEQQDINISNKEQSEKANQSEEEIQKSFDMLSSEKSEEEQQEINEDKFKNNRQNQQPLNNSKDQYDEMNIDQLLNEQNQSKQDQNQGALQKPRQEKKNNWIMDVDDLLEDEEKQEKELNEEDKQKKQKSKKMHLMLFDDDDLE